MAGAEPHSDGAPFVEVSMNYAPRQEDRPAFAAESRPGARRPGLVGPDRRRVHVTDARAVHPAPTLDGAGFMLASLETQARDLFDEREVREVYYPEVEALVARETGAVRVMAFDFNLRSTARAGQEDSGIQGPVKFAHNDYTERSGPQRVRDLLPGEAPDLLTRRFAVINVWKPIGEPAVDVPLGICDARTIAPEDLIASDLQYRDRTGEVYSLTFSPAHRWYYYRAMRPDEAMLLKCFDSAGARARFTAHGAFRDPSAPEGAPPRESIEVRTLAFFAD